MLHLLSRSAAQAFHIATGRPVLLVTLWLFTGLVLVALCTRSGLHMHPLRLYHGSLLFECMQCLALLLRCLLHTYGMHVSWWWQSMDFGLLLGFEWIVYVSFLHLQAYHSDWAPCHS